MVVGHIAPEAQDGGPIAYLRTGDIVTVDQDTKEISMAVSDEELWQKRKAETTSHRFIAAGYLVNMPIWYPRQQGVTWTSGNQKPVRNNL